MVFDIDEEMKTLKTNYLKNHDFLKDTKISSLFEIKSYLCSTICSFRVIVTTLKTIFMKKQSFSPLFLFLGILFTTSLLISNILAVKIIQIFSFSAPAGVLIFPIAYILNDIIVEVYGFNKAKFIIWLGFLMNILMLIFFTLSISLPSSPFWEHQEAYQLILGSTPRIVFASLMAYILGNFMNALIMSKMKVLFAGKSFSARAILSTLFGESLDSTVFITIAFIGIFPIKVILIMIVTQALIKTAYEIIILPITMFLVSKVKKWEGEDVFDTNISYNPFTLKI